MNAAIEAASVTRSAPVKATWVCLILAWVLFLVPLPGLGMFIGWPLNLVAFILAIVVMARGFTGKGLLPLIASLIVSPIVYFIGLAIFGAALSGASKAANTDTTATAVSAQVAEVAPPAADAIKVTAHQLFSAYEANEIAADGQYKGKTLEVSGVVSGIDSDFSDEPVIELATENEFMGVRAQGIDKTVAANLSKGQQVTLVCTGGGEVVGAPMLEDCSIR